MRKQQLKTWRKQRLLLRYALSTRECPLDFLSFSILILMMKVYHLKESLFSITASLIAHLLVVQIEMAGDINLARWKMEDLLRIVTPRFSIIMDTNNMQSHLRMRLTPQDGTIFQDRLTKREDSMVQRGIATMMEAYTLGNTRMVGRQKERSMSCKRIKLTHSSKSNMIMEKRLREKRSAEDIKWFEVTTKIHSCTRRNN